MAIVEHMAIPMWARRITVKREGDRLIVRGEDRRDTPVPATELSAGEDFLRQYTEYSKQWSEKRCGKRPPHIQFANAKTDDELAAFIGQFGPVQTSGPL